MQTSQEMQESQVERTGIAQGPRAGLLREALSAFERLIEWDKSRSFIVPYKVRDPIHAVIKAIREGDEPQPSTPGESGFAPLPSEPYPRWPFKADATMPGIEQQAIAKRDAFLAGKPPCAICGIPYEKHGSAPTCASHDYTDGGHIALLVAAPRVAVSGCTRPHPHENMSADCERLSVMAQEQNAAARGAVGINGLTEAETNGTASVMGIVSRGVAAVSAVPVEVMAALDRMSTPLHESWGSVARGATAAADARDMQTLRDFIMRAAGVAPIDSRSPVTPTILPASTAEK